MKHWVRFKARFMEIGYESQDIDSALTVYTDGIYTGTPNVTNAGESKDTDVLQ